LPGGAYGKAILRAEGGVYNIRKSFGERRRRREKKDREEEPKKEIASTRLKNDQEPMMNSHPPRVRSQPIRRKGGRENF